MVAYLGQQLHHRRHRGRCLRDDRLQLLQRVGPRLGRQEAHDRVADTLGLGGHRVRDGRGQEALGASTSLGRAWSALGG